jgi:hypothetical protein
MEQDPPRTRRSHRLVLSMPADLGDELYQSAVRNLRDPKRHALYLITDGLRREKAGEPARVARPSGAEARER